MAPDPLKPLRDAALARLSPNASVEDVSGYLFNVRGGSAARPRGFLDMHRMVCGRAPHKIAGDAFWRWLSESWSGFDLIPHDFYATAFAKWRPYWSVSCMRLDAQHAFNDLPETGIRVFRGQDELSPIGLSWTLDRNVAKAFARGHRGILNQYPVVYELEIARTDVALVQLDREEREVVLFEVPSDVSWA